MLSSSTHRLRAIEPRDVAQLLDWENDATTWWLGASLAPYSEATMLKFAEGDHDIYRDKQLRFMLDVKTDVSKWQTVGVVDLYEFDPRNNRAGVGIVVGETHRRKGHAVEGLMLLANYAFKHLGAHQLFAEVPAIHESSVNLFLKAGYTKSETRTDWVRKDGEWIDVSLMQKIAGN